MQRLGFAAAALVLAGCGGDGPNEPATYTVGGTVSGIAGVGCVIRNNGGDDLVLNANGPFAFPTRLAAGAPYSATVFHHPNGPTQTCTITNGTGMVGNANVTEIAVSCAVDRAACEDFDELPSVSGDVDFHAASAMALGERSYRVRLTEDSFDSRRVAAHVVLEVPDGVNYNLFVSCQSCTGFTRGSTRGTGEDEVLEVRWEDRAGPDDSAYILIRVSYQSGSSTTPWTLRVRGNQDVATATCSLTTG